MLIDRVMIIGFLAIVIVLPTLAAEKVDLSGQWEIEEEERTYIATLDVTGNGTYTWQNGQITTASFVDGRWQGSWNQTGNDREGGFDIVLSPDGSRAEGKWWYIRVGQQKIPPGEWGGPFTWKRISPVPASSP